MCVGNAHESWGDDDCTVAPTSLRSPEIPRRSAQHDAALTTVKLVAMATAVILAMRRLVDVDAESRFILRTLSPVLYCTICGCLFGQLLNEPSHEAAKRLAESSARSFGRRLDLHA